MNEILVIGNKPYFHINLDEIIDSFENNVHCNMGIPCKNNGTKKDKIAFCCHLYKNVIEKKVSGNELESSYKKEYKNEYVRFFHQNFKTSDYNEVIPQVAKGHYIKKYNKYLNSIGCPYTFSKQPRTGHSVMMKYLLEGYEVYVIGFSITNETRKTYYVQDFVFEKDNKEKSCHSKKDEIKILRWLHSNKFIDATLCLLEDLPSATINLNDLSASKKILYTIRSHYGDVEIL